MNSAFNTAVSTMRGKLGTVASAFIVDPLWLESKTYNGLTINPEILFTHKGGSYFSGLSAKSIQEQLSEIKSTLGECQWSTFSKLGTSITRGYQQLRFATGSTYTTAEAAWAATQNMAPTTQAFNVWGILSKTGTPPKWSADQMGMDITLTLGSTGLYSGGANWFVRVTAASGPGVLLTPRIPADALFHAQRVVSGSSVKFRIDMPTSYFTSGGTSHDNLIISDHVTFRPEFTHKVAGAAPDSPSTCQRSALNSAHFVWSMGAAKVGERQGSIALSHENASLLWYSPDTLECSLGDGFSVVRDASQHLLQAYGPTVVADVSNVTALGYQLKFYNRNPAWTIGTGGRITTSGTPYLIASVANPDGTGATTNRLRITETRGTNVKWWEFEYSTALSQWRLTQSETQAIETITKSAVNALGEWTEDRMVAFPDGTVVSQVRETHKQFPWGNEIISSVDDPTGLARTTTYTFSVSDGYQSYGQVKQKTFPNGSWEKRTFDSIRRVKKIITPWQNAPITAPENQCRVIEYTYASDTTPVTDYTTTVEKVLGIEVSRKYRRDLWDGYDEYVTQTQGAAITAADNLVTKYRTYLNSIFAGRQKSLTRPDGTMAIYEHQANAATLAAMTELTTIVSDGTPNAAGTAIIDGTRTTTLTNRQGYVIFTSTLDIASGLIIAQKQATQVDEFDRPVAETNLDGTSELTVYNCCKVESRVDSRGIQTTYGEAPEVKTRTSLGLVWKDKTLGREQVQTRTGTDNVEIEMSRQERNIAGELIRTVSPASGTTLQSLQYTATESITTLTHADGGTEVQKRWLDGTLKSITGTAVFPKRYDSGVNANGTRWTKEIALDAAGADTAEWTTTTTDAAGRTITVTRADGAVASRFYNAKNQLIKTVDPDGVTMLYAYDARGRLLRSALDMNRNGIIDLGGTDRVTETTSLVTTRTGGRVVNRATVKVWTTINDATTTVITSTTDAAVNGLDVWSVVCNVETRAQTVYQGSGNWIVTTTYGDASTSTSTYTGGRLASVVRKTNASATIAATVYGYDPRGRVLRTTDARGGVTDLVYDSADRVQSVTGPDPGDGNPRPVSTFGYDAVGRQNSTTDIAGGTTLTLYNPNGTIQTTGGTRIYPLSYTYTPQGRMETMTTATGVTTWQYIPTNGLLWKKFDDGSLAWTYGYTSAGRLRTRLNARGITTTYGYDFAGAQQSVDYADATPDIAYTFNRLGQVSTAVRGGITRTLTANAWGQLTQETWTGGGWTGLQLTHGRDALRRRNALTVMNGAQILSSQGFTYDGASRLNTVTASADAAATYAYVAGSSLIDTISFTHQAQVKAVSDRGYNLAGRLEEIRTVNAANTTQSLAAYQHDALNRRTRSTREDGSKWDWGYTDRSEVTASAQSFSDGTAHPMRQYGYNYDAIGNRITATRSGHTETYTTNNQNQYTQRTVPGFEHVEGEADAAANVLVNAQPAERKGTAFWKEWTASNTASARWDTARTVAARPGAGPGGEDLVTIKEGRIFLPQTPEAFIHDTDGNLTQDGRWNYTWDGENRLTAVETRADINSSVPRQRIEFDYDDAGRRIAKRVLNWNTATAAFVLNKSLRFLYDGWNLVAEFNFIPQTSSFILLRSYAWGTDLSGSEQGAGGVGGLLFVSVFPSTINSPPSTTLSPAYDGNGNVTAWLEAATGAVSAAFDYDAFGNLLAVTPRPLSSSAAAVAIPIGFSTKYRDAETGTLYYGLRDYSPPLARWLSRDPIEESGGVNLYGMVENDSVNRVDNLGLAAENPLSYYLPYLYPGVFDPPSGFPNAVWNAVLLSAPVKGYIEKIFNMSKHIGRGCDVTEFEAEGLDDHVWLAASEGLPMEQKIKAGLIAGGIDINIPPGKITVNCRAGTSCTATGEVTINIKDTYGFGPWSGDAHTRGANTVIKYLSCIWGGIPKDYKNSDSKTFPVNYTFILNQ